MAEEAAETEPAWQNAGTSVGLQIWRIVVSILANNVCNCHIVLKSFHLRILLYCTMTWLRLSV